MMGRHDDASRGQGLAEFVVAFPFIVLLLFGLFDAGRAVLYFTELTNASRAGARVAVVNQSNDDTCTKRTFKCAAADLATTTGIPPSEVPDLVITDRDGNVVATDAGVCQIYGTCSVTVDVSFTFEPVTPFVGSVFGSIGLTGSTTMQIERSFASP